MRKQEKNSVGICETYLLLERRIVMNLGPIEYTVARIDGDYAYLLQPGQSQEEEKCVARALLPPEIAEGTKIHYEMMQYTIA